ncbi:hypothetical protein E8L99_14465 [Phreatobacter aquaticus]|uniref:Uncharacterized protein n=1 Tax=Phreatobacter aquaticus TaxID=2570229 RepID=A0A4D7QLJ3_9HYPH|nr:hypothetical protein [Phreatobacter aquaticus]QCK86873.1 hypothetical protein E8L99_14465 [Phreatobacter aquaticus]
MTDLFIASNRADKERAEIIRQALAALDVAVFPDVEIKARTAATKAARESAATARVVLALWPEAVLDPTENQGALYGVARLGLNAKKLVAARLSGFDPAKLEPPFDGVAAPDLGAWLADSARRGDDPAWLELVGAVGAIIDRPALADLATAIEADRGKADLPAQRAFARHHPQDPSTARIWSEIERTERERFAVEFRKAHSVLVDRANAAQDRLKQTVEGFSGYMKAVRAGEQAVPPDPKDAISDGVAALRETAARLANDNERLRSALERAEARSAEVQASKPRLTRFWATAAAVALLAGTAVGGSLVEAYGPLRGNSHPRIAALAQQRSSVAEAATAEIAKLREQARTTARRAETAEANLQVARTNLAHAQTEVTRRQSQASETNGNVARLQSELQAQQAARALAEQQAREAASRLAASEQEMRTLREARVQGAPDRDVTGSIAPRSAPPEARPQAEPTNPAPGQLSVVPVPPQAAPQAPVIATVPLPAPRPSQGDVTGSIPQQQPQPTDGPYRHRRDRWSFHVAPGFAIESDNDLPGPVNSVMVHERNRDAVVVVSANNARASGACTPQAWYFENIVEGSRQRRGPVIADGGLPRNAGGLQGFAIRGRGVLQGERFRSDLDYYDLVVQGRGEPGVVYLIQARFPRQMADEMIRSVDEMWKSFQLTGPRAYPTRC